MKHLNWIITVSCACILSLTAAPLCAGLTDYTAYYNFDDSLAAGTTNHYNLQFVGAQSSPYVTTSIVGKALDLLGNSNNMAGGKIANMPLIAGATQAITVSYWARITDTSSASDAGVVTIGYGVGNRMLQITSRNSIRKQWLTTFNTSDAATTTGLGTADALANEWFHVVARFSRDPSTGQATISVFNTRISRNSRSEGASNTQTIATTVLDTPSDTGGLLFASQNFGFVVGRNVGAIYKGQIDELAIWNRALSDAEVDQLFLAGKQGVAVSNIPEPATLSLLAVGSLLLRRR